MSTQTVLDPERVDAIFTECLIRADEDSSSCVTIDGIDVRVVFHPERLQEHKDEIVAMLDELPEEFKRSGGSFLNACNDRHNNQWTSLHRQMEALFLLGIGINRVQYLLPREEWQFLLGGMPFLVIN
ncbi:MAG: hypothetical protein AAB384_04390 [Patescibacteria group bacterium]